MSNQIITGANVFKNIRTILSLMIYFLILASIPMALCSETINSNNNSYTNSNNNSYINANNYTNVYNTISTPTLTPTHIPINTSPANDKDTCKLDWKWHTTDHIGTLWKAPTGYTYVIVDLYLKNDAAASIKTSPFMWSFVIDGVNYYCDVATFDPSVLTTTPDINKGGEIETKLVYKVKGYPTKGSLNYLSLKPTLQRISHTFN